MYKLCIFCNSVVIQRLTQLNSHGIQNFKRIRRIILFSLTQMVCVSKIFTCHLLPCQVDAKFNYHERSNPQKVNEKLMRVYFENNLLTYFFINPIISCFILIVYLTVHIAVLIVNLPNTTPSHTSSSYHLQNLPCLSLYLFLKSLLFTLFLLFLYLYIGMLI